MVLESAFQELTLIMVLAAGLAILFKAIKQPAVLSYITVGLLLGPIGLFELSHESFETLESLAKLGITFLLFILGLELKIGKLRSVGSVAVITGVAQIVFTSLIGFGMAKLLGFSNTPSMYLGIGLTFSSTIVIVKLLSDKKDLDSLYGRISIGFLLVQDFFAIMALVVLTGLGSASEAGSNVVGELGWILFKSVLAIALVIWLSKELVPSIVHYIARSQEILFIFAIAWAFGMASLMSEIGLSVEIGGFLAGLALANSTESLQIVSKVRALRDFFIVLFFVALGAGLSFTNVGAVLVPGLIFSAFVLIGNPFIVMAILGMMGYRKRTGFNAGLTVAQISEFSLIVVSIGIGIGHLGSEANDVNAVLTIVSLITFTLSSYMVINSDKLYKILAPYLSIFERKTLSNHKNDQQLSLDHMKKHIIVLGAHRLGLAIIENLNDRKSDILVVDIDPDAISHIAKLGYNHVFGDIVDPDIQDAVNIEEADVIISTIPNHEENMILASKVTAVNPDAKLIVVAKRDHHVRALETMGVDIVLQPFAYTGKVLGSTIAAYPEDFIAELREHEFSA